jgi:hypothetical protein
MSPPPELSIFSDRQITGWAQLMQHDKAEDYMADSHSRKQIKNEWES